MNLVIDKGNTLCKIGIFKNNQLLDNCITVISNKELNVAVIARIIQQYTNIANIIISTVSDLTEELDIYFQSNFTSYIKANSNTKVPITNKYASRETLGFDRLAASVGGTVLFPKRNIIIFDAGTALTIEQINDNNEYLGGNISPGLNMRFRALHEFTNKLPKVIANEQYIELGNSTETAIRAGVQLGMKHEILGYITYFSNNLPNPVFILTGGDSFYFDKTLKNYIFAAPNLVLIGLNRILEYNVHKI